MHSLVLGMAMAAQTALGGGGDPPDNPSQRMDRARREVAAQSVMSAPKMEASMPGSRRGQISIIVSGLSYHYASRFFNDEKGVKRRYNEANMGIGLSYALSDKFSVNVGFYKNSVYRRSVYLTTSYEPSAGKIGGGVEAGIVSGYTPKGPVPLVAGFARVGGREDPVSVRIGTVPPILGAPKVIGAQFKLNPAKMIP